MPRSAHAAALIATALLCACAGPPGEPPDAGDVALPTGEAGALLAQIEPVELRVHALTRLERAPDSGGRTGNDGGAQRLAVHLELLDQFGQGVKGLGRAVVVLHPRRAGVPDALIGGVQSVAGGVGTVVGGVGGAVGNVVDTVTGRAAENHDRGETAPAGSATPPASAAEAGARGPLDGPLPPGALRYVRDLTQPRANADAFDWVTRCYVIPCGDLTPELLSAASRGDLRIEATFSVLRADGTRRLSRASYVLPAAK